MTANQTFIMVARLLYDKGYREYVEAARIVKRQYPECVFEVLGPLDEQSPMGVPRAVVEKDSQDGIIRYLGVTNNVVPYMDRHGLVAVLPSSYAEGLNRFLMEACAMGCPIITTDTPGCRETVDEGKNGFTVPIKNPEALADAIIRYIQLSDKEKEQMIRHSRTKAENCFNLNIVIDYYKNIVEEIVHEAK